MVKLTENLCCVQDSEVLGAYRKILRKKPRLGETKRKKLRNGYQMGKHWTWYQKFLGVQNPFFKRVLAAGGEKNENKTKNRT